MEVGGEVPKEESAEIQSPSGKVIRVESEESTVDAQVVRTRENLPER